MDNNIIIKNLSVEFQTNKIINDLSIEFQGDKITAIIGETGSGKSILVTSILKLLDESAKVSGEIIFKGENILEYNSKEIRKIRGAKIGYIPQNPTESFNKVLKIRTQLEEILKAHNKSLTRRERKKIMNKSLREVGFKNPTDISNSYPLQLSGGMMQRVLSLFGVISEPEWVIADEPTKGLDAILRRQVLNILKKIKTTKTKSMIIVTHDLELAYHIGEEIIVMRKGEIVEKGKPEEIFFNPKDEYTKALISSILLR